MVDLRRTLRTIDRGGRRHRRLIASALTAGAVFAALHELAPPPAPTTGVVIAARDLPAGAELRPGDLRIEQMSPDLVPDGSYAHPSALVGRTIASPQRGGTPLTDVSIVAGSLIERYGPGLLAAPVRIADRTAVALLRVGDHIAVFGATGRNAGSAQLIIADSPVVALPSVDDRTDGAVVVIAVTADQDAAITQAATQSPLSIALRR